MFLLRQCQKTFESISSEWSFCAGAAAGVIFPPAAFAACLLLPFNRFFWVAAGTLLALLFQWGNFLFSEPHFEKFINGRTASVEYEIKLTDQCMSELSCLDRRKGVTARVQKIRPAGAKEFLPCSGEVILYSNLPTPRKYGSVLTGRGALRLSNAPQLRKRWLLQSDICRLERVERTFRGGLLVIRDKFLEKLCSNIRNDTNRNLAAAFFFGFTGGLTTERRQDFAAAGTIHLFAVSGLHVGMAALLVLWGLRFLPFRLRCFGAVLLIWFYVLLTGAAVPAVRAGFMIGVFLICRGLLLSVSPLRLLGAAAGIIVITDPGAIHEAGFQFSFFITAVLLLLGKKMRQLDQLEERPFHLMPFTPHSTWPRRLFRWRKNFRDLVISGSAAAAASSVVALNHTIALAPGAAAANIVTVPVLGVLFALLPVKLLCACISENLDQFAALPIDFLFNYLRFAAATTSRIAAPFFASPPGIAVASLMGAMILAGLTLRKNYALAAWGIFLILFLAFPLKTFFEKPKLTVVSSDAYLPPSIVVTDTRLGETTIINPVRAHLNEINSAIRSGGTPRISEVAFSHPYVRHATALEYLDSRYRIDKVILPGSPRRNWQFFDRITERPGKFYYVQEGKGTEKLRIFRKNFDFAIEYPDSGVMLGWKLEINNTDHGREVNFHRNGKKLSALLPWSNKNGVWQHEL